MSDTTPSDTTPAVWQIVINGRPREVHSETESFEDVVTLALGSVPTGDGVRITVSFHNSDDPQKRNGTLMPGQSVRVKREGTSFDVHQTNRS